MLAFRTSQTTHGWDIREGSSQEIGATLEKDQSDVLVFISHASSDALNRKRFEALKRVANLVDDLLEQKSVDKWKAIVEALTPDIELSPTMLVEAKMMSAARSSILKTGDFVSAKAIADLADFSSKNKSSQPNRWKRKREIFAITHKATDYYPMYALDRTRDFKPLPAVRTVLELFDGKKDGWQTAFWFGSANSYLRNRMPKDLLQSDANRVIEAAKIESTGVVHG